MSHFDELWKARMILEDGTILRGTSFGADGEAQGEIVFNTVLTGYQEVLTDPSYHGQVVVMTYPLIGNYGINSDDGESPKPQSAGLIVREASRIVSNHRATESLPDYLKRHGIVALEGVDTRFITRRIRNQGAMKVFMTTETLSDDEMRARLQDVPDLVGEDYVSQVTCSESKEWSEGWHEEFRGAAPQETTPRRRVVTFDFGAKENIHRSLYEVGFDVVVVPASTTADEVRALEPDGIFLSNGPGDPRPLTGVIETIKSLMGELPIFGICLGHQLLSLANGAEVVKLKFGHHGGNHPVQNLDTMAVEITSQNHGFAVTPESIEAVGGRVTHINLNDQTVEGLEFTDLNAFSVQYHPEASPGPHDSIYLFERFRGMVEDAAGERAETTAG